MTGSLRRIGYDTTLKLNKAGVQDNKGLRRIGYDTTLKQTRVE